LVASLIFDDNRLYVTDAEEVVALDLDALEAGREPVLWSTPLSGEKIATPVVVDGLLFAVSESGSAACLDAKTGKLEWEHEFPGLFFASIVAFGQNVMFTSESGDAWLVNCSRRFLLTARNSFGEKIYATPVPQKDAILIRTLGNLYCVAAGIDRPRL